MSVFRVPFCIGFISGFLSLTAVPMASASSGATGVPAISVQELARLSWPHLSPDQQVMVDIVARDLFEIELSPEQRERIAGSSTARYDSLSEWNKAPFRGMALKNLGHDEPEDLRQAI